MSFSEIQLLQQLDHLDGTSTPKEKRSLLEIQEEERSRQQEEEFLRWWAAEEERVKQELAEQEVLLSRANQAKGKGKDTSRKAKGSRRKPRHVDATQSSPTYRSRDSRSAAVREERKGS